MIYAWSTLTFPTFTEPRYATPLIMLIFWSCSLGLREVAARGAHPRHPRRAAVRCSSPGTWAPTDPVSRKLFGTTLPWAASRSTTPNERHRGPDRMDINFSLLEREPSASNERLRRIYASGATLVAGDCNAMKFGEKLYSVGLHADAFRSRAPGRAAAEVRVPAGPAAGRGQRPRRDRARPHAMPEEDAAEVAPRPSPDHRSSSSIEGRLTVRNPGTPPAARPRHMGRTDHCSTDP